MDRSQRKKKTLSYHSTRTGLEPAAFGVEIQCAIRCATKPMLVDERLHQLELVSFKVLFSVY